MVENYHYTIESITQLYWDDGHAYGVASGGIIEGSKRIGNVYESEGK